MAVKCYVQLGKHGDVIQLMPGFKWYFDTFKERPVVMVSDAYAGTLDGCSYVIPWPVPYDFFSECEPAKRLAQAHYGSGNVVFPKWWDDPDYVGPVLKKGDKYLTVRHKRIALPPNGWFSYQESQWVFGGFPLDRMYDPVIIDRRSAHREHELVRLHFKNLKPKLLLSFSPKGSSSPFQYTHSIAFALEKWAGKFDIIDLSGIAARRIYDLLGLYDRAAGLIATDTATLHLAGASLIPHVALVNDGGAGSLPRGQCHHVIRYSQVPQSLNLIDQFLERLWKSI